MKKVCPAILAAILVCVCAALLVPFRASAASESGIPDNAEEAKTLANPFTGWPEADPGKIAKVHITYDLRNGKTQVLDGNGAEQLLARNSDGSLYVDPATGKYVLNPYNMTAYIQQLAQQVPSETPSQSDFVTTSGKTVHFDKVTTVGTTVAVQDEMNYLAAVLINGATDQHTISVKDLTNLGTSYIEIDMENQTLYCYLNGSLMLSTPIVTGNMAAGHNSPQGVFTILARQRNVTLVGKDYKSFVKYWCPIVGNSIGIHDASWRKKFGGTQYLKNGSHGCINVPPEVMPNLYEFIYKGMPVVAFY